MIYINFVFQASDVNISAQTLVSRRLVKDYMRALGGIENVVISKELLSNAQMASRRYHTYLETQKMEKEKKRVDLKRKMDSNGDILKKKHC